MTPPVADAGPQSPAASERLRFEVHVQMTTAVVFLYSDITGECMDK